MNNATATAINKAKCKSEKLAVGRHAVDAVVRVRGDLVVHEDQMIKATASLMSVEFLLLTLQRAGVTRESAMRTISEVAGDYLVNWTGSKEDKRDAKAERMKALAEYDPEGKGSDVFAKFAESLPRVPRAGKVVFEGSVEEVQGAIVESIEEAV